MSIICTPLERLIHLLSNGVTNSIFIFLDIRLISLGHVTYHGLYFYSHDVYIKFTKARYIYLNNLCVEGCGVEDILFDFVSHTWI